MTTIIDGCRKKLTAKIEIIIYLSWREYCGDTMKLSAIQ